MISPAAGQGEEWGIVTLSKGVHSDANSATLTKPINARCRRYEFVCHAWRGTSSGTKQQQNLHTAVGLPPGLKDLDGPPCLPCETSDEYSPWDTPSTTPKKRYLKRRQQQHYHDNHDEYHHARKNACRSYGELVGAHCPTAVSAN